MPEPIEDQLGVWVKEDVSSTVVESSHHERDNEYCVLSQHLLPFRVKATFLHPVQLAEQPGHDECEED